MERGTVAGMGAAVFPRSPTVRATSPPFRTWYACAMLRSLDPLRLLLFSVAGWMRQPQGDAIAYLQEENRVLREQLGTRRLRLNDDQRRRLAAKAKLLGRRIHDLATIVSPATLLAWHRKMV